MEIELDANPNRGKAGQHKQCGWFPPTSAPPRRTEPRDDPCHKDEPTRQLDPDGRCHRPGVDRPSVDAPHRGVAVRTHGGTGGERHCVTDSGDSGNGPGEEWIDGCNQRFMGHSDRREGAGQLSVRDGPGGDSAASMSRGAPVSEAKPRKTAVATTQPSRHHDAESGLSSQSLRRDCRSSPRSSVGSATRVGVGAPPSAGGLFTVEKNTDLNGARRACQQRRSGFPTSAVTRSTLLGGWSRTRECTIMGSTVASRQEEGDGADPGA